MKKNWKRINRTKQLSLWDHHNFYTSDWIFLYPGSKMSARTSIVKMTPKGIKEAVSPFMGSACVEMLYGTMGMKVHCSDLNPSIVLMWKYIVSEGEKLADFIEEKVHTMTKEELSENAENDYHLAENELEKAGYALLHVICAFRGIITQDGRHGDFFYNEANDSIYVRTVRNQAEYKVHRCENLRNFNNPNLIIGDPMDFEEALNRHPNAFSYCDPPYSDVPGLGLYIDRNEFDHERLRDVLSTREAPWLLSYSRKPIIEELYPESEFDWTNQFWYAKSSVQKVIEDEVLIRPRKYLDYWK